MFPLEKMIEIVIGSEEKRQWTFDNLWYNIPLDKIADSPWNQAKYLLLYVKGEKFVGNLCKIVRTKHDVWTKEKLGNENYPDALLVANSAIMLAEYWLGVFVKK